jgi:P4 family phage/plasmid primase-like protien
MPNQTKEMKPNTEHIIIRGEIKDFIVNYIPNDSINIDDKVFVQSKNKKSNNKIIITDEYLDSDNDSVVLDKKIAIKQPIIKNIVDKIEGNDKIIIENNKISFFDIKDTINNLNKERADIYDDWSIVGMGLKNISNEQKMLDLWIEWSKHSDKFKEGECEKKWKTFTKKDKSYNFGTILKMLKTDNKDKFISICKKLNIKNIIMERKKYFPNNELEIDNIISNCNSHYIQLADKYCPIIKGEHNKRCNYMEINKLGQIVLKCFCQDCRGKEFPQDNILMLSKNELGTIFNLTQNNYITINNINNPETNDPNEIYSDIIKLDSNAKIFEDNELNKLMLESLSGSDSTISQVLFHLLKNKNYCSKDKIWFEFKDHRWIESELITTYVSDEFVKYYQKIITYVKNSQEISKTEKNTSVKEIQKIIKLLQSKNRKSNIIDEFGVRLRINNPKFLEILDTKPYIIGFDNGIYDLNEMKFRDGISSDMISMSCNYEFKAEYSKHKENLLTFLKEILPVDNDREYFLTYLSSCLIGLNICELFTILTGKGRNGKSKLIELIAFTMGDYIGRPKCKLLTGSRPDENSPEPGLLLLKKKRIIMVSEPEVGDKLNSGFIKFITGGDTEMLRKCHKNEMETFKANFLTFLVCNDIPDIDNMDNAFTKRLRCINFPTEFVANPTLPHQKKIDETLQTKLMLWKNDFMLLLLEYYNKFKQGNLTPPKNVLEWTNMYKEEVDMYFNFLNDCTKEAETHVSNVQLYMVFQEWFKTNYGNEKMPNNRGFLAGVRKYKNIEKCIWVDGKTTTGIKNLNFVDL